MIKLSFWLILFIRLVFSEKGSTSENKSEYSVIIAIKNGGKHLNKLAQVLNQRGLKELILVDDYSDKETKSMIQTMDSDQLVKIHASEDILGKKQAIHDGIEASNTDHIVFTDIDCVPASENWAELMCAPLNDGYDIVLSYGPYKNLAGWLNSFIRFETLMTAIQYLSYSLARIPYMGVGRNMAYKKSVFYKLGGFNNHKQIASGDDDLLVQSAFRKAKVAVVLDSKAFTYSEPATTMAEFLAQKSRHVTTAASYKLIHQILLICFAASHILFYILFLFLSIASTNGIVWQVYLLTILPMWIIFTLISKKLKEIDLAVWFPIFDLVYFIYMIILSPKLIFKRTRW